MSKGIEMLDDTVLYQMFGAKGVEELRSKLIDMIVKEVHDQLRQSYNYIISPDDIASDLYNDIIEEIKVEIIEEYKDAIKKSFEEKLKGIENVIK